MTVKNSIMIVEDEGATAMVIQRNLEEMGYTITSVETTAEGAVKKASEEKPDLVLMDIVLDGAMDGIEAARQIYSGFNIPVVYITAHSDEKIVQRITTTEPFGYIIKPFDERDLRIAVEIALYKHRMETKLRKSENELKRHRERLMELVEERTSELQKTNKKLELEIREREMAEAEALRAGHLAALGELAAGVAHEINNPINGIINYAEILANESREGSKEHDILIRIIKEGERIANIVMNLLSFARDSREKKHPVHLHEIINDALALTEIQLIKDGIRLKVDVPVNLPEIVAQPQQIQQVVLNIISNARYALNQKYQEADEDNILEITGKEISVDNVPYIQITFYDKGTGIPAAIQDKVMNPFFTTKPNRIGTGLGLSISHGVINDHRGRINIKSAEGEFTKVTIELPCSNGNYGT
jgi:signal transduction histidine kinase